MVSDGKAKTATTAMTRPDRAAASYPSGIFFLSFFPEIRGENWPFRWIPILSMYFFDQPKKILIFREEKRSNLISTNDIDSLVLRMRRKNEAQSVYECIQDHVRSQITWMTKQKSRGPETQRYGRHKRAEVGSIGPIRRSLENQGTTHRAYTHQAKLTRRHINADWLGLT